MNRLLQAKTYALADSSKQALARAAFQYYYPASQFFEYLKSAPKAKDAAAAVVADLDLVIPYEPTSISKAVCPATKEENDWWFIDPRKNFPQRLKYFT